MTGDSLAGISRQALALAAALQTISRSQPHETQSACVDYASLVDEIAVELTIDIAHLQSTCLHSMLQARWHCISTHLLPEFVTERLQCLGQGVLAQLRHRPVGTSSFHN